MAGCRGKQRACPPLCTLLCSLAFLLGPACFCQKEVPSGHLLFLFHRRSGYYMSDVSVSKMKGEAV